MPSQLDGIFPTKYTSPFLCASLCSFSLVSSLWMVLPCNLDLAITGDPVDNLGAFLLRKSALDPGQHGAECPPRTWKTTLKLYRLHVHLMSSLTPETYGSITSEGLSSSCSLWDPTDDIDGGMTTRASG